MAASSMSVAKGSSTRSSHPAFSDAARTYAEWFDLKADPALRELMSVEEDEERFSLHWLQPRTQADLRRRTRMHRRLAEFHFGLFGRTPDAVAGNITGLAMAPEVFDSAPGGNAANLLANYRRMRRDDVFCDIRDCAAARRAQPRVLRQQGFKPTGAPRHRGGRCRGNPEWHEDAGHGRRLCS